MCLFYIIKQMNNQQETLKAAAYAAETSFSAELCHQVCVVKAWKAFGISLHISFTSPKKQIQYKKIRVWCRIATLANTSFRVEILQLFAATLCCAGLSADTSSEILKSARGFPSISANFRVIAVARAPWAANVTSYNAKTLLFSMKMLYFNCYKRLRWLIIN